MNTLLGLQNELIIIEKEHYIIMDSYIKGMLLYEDIRRFEKLLFSFRTALFSYIPNDEELLVVAKMKSKVQHYNTDVLEDEDVLNLAYKNSYGYTEKL